MVTSMSVLHQQFYHFVNQLDFGIVSVIQFDFILRAAAAGEDAGRQGSGNENREDTLGHSGKPSFRGEFKGLVSG